MAEINPSFLKLSQNALNYSALIYIFLIKIGTHSHAINVLLNCKTKPSLIYNSVNFTNLKEEGPMALHPSPPTESMLDPEYYYSAVFITSLCCVSISRF